MEVIGVGPRMCSASCWRWAWCREWVMNYSGPYGSCSLHRDQGPLTMSMAAAWRVSAPLSDPYGPVVPQARQAHTPPAPGVGPTATHAGIWQSTMSGPLAATPAVSLARYPFLLPNTDCHQWVGQSTASKQHTADEQQQHQQQQHSIGADLPLSGQKRTASCISKQGTPRQGSSNATGSSVQPSAEAAEAAVHSLRLLLASVPPPKLHSALASVLSQVRLPSCVPTPC